jgi:hypothetical protein
LENVFSDITPEKKLEPTYKETKDERFPRAEEMEPKNML